MEVIDHRDLKPANVLIAEGDGDVQALRVKLADFGVSTLIGGQVAAQDGSTGDQQPRRPSRIPLPEEVAGEVLGEEAAWEGETITPQSNRAVGVGGAAEAAELAEASTGDGEQLTQTGILVGTPMYMAPELSDGSHHARPPSDVFSLGMIAYELFSGEIPFARPPVWARWRGKDVPAPSLADRRSDLPGEVVKLIDSCLQLDPALRPTADTIAVTLRAHVHPSYSI